MTASTPPHLLYFRVSHYNEKVRWALDPKGLLACSFGHPAECARGLGRNRVSG